MAFEEYKAFRKRAVDDEAGASKTAVVETPDEQIERQFQALRRDLAEQLLSELMQRSPGFFEKVVVNLLRSHSSLALDFRRS